MRTYRFKRQTNRFGIFAGVTAQAQRTRLPAATGDQISERVWLDASQIQDRFRDAPLPLTDQQVEDLRSGLREVADDIQQAEPDRHVLITVRALEIVEVDYIDGILAPAIAGWAAEEFGFTPHQIDVKLDGPTKQVVFEWGK